MQAINHVMTLTGVLLSVMAYQAGVDLTLPRFITLHPLIGG